MEEDPTKVPAPNQIPSLLQVTEAYSAILEHNQDKTGVGMLYQRHLGRLFGEKEEKVSPTEEGDMNADVIEIVYGETFERIGIHIEPNMQWINEETGEPLASADLVPSITNPTLFIDFLSTLSDSDLSMNNESQELLLDAIITLRQTAKIYFSGAKEDGLSEDERRVLREAGEDTLRTFMLVDSEYKKLGIEEGKSYKEGITYLDDAFLLGPAIRKYERYLTAYKVLGQMVEYWGKDLLPEYIDPLDKSLLSEASRLRPYAASAGLVELDTGNLTEDLEYIVELFNDLSTRAMAIKVMEAFSKSIEATAQEIKDSHDAEYGSTYLEILEKAKSLLNKLANHNQDS